MIWFVYIFLAILLGIGELSFFRAYLWFFYVYAFFTAKDLIYREDPIFHIPTRYQVYLDELNQRGLKYRFPWMRYLAQGIFVDSLFFIIPFWIVRIIARLF